MSEIHPILIDRLAQYKGKQVLLLWSGGLDSTALLVGLLQAGALVQAIDVDAPNLPNIAAERVARKAIKRYVLKHWPCRFRTVKLDGFQGGGVFAYSQATWWLSILPSLMGGIEDYVMLGWVAGDETVALLEDYQRLWSSLKPLVRLDCTLPELHVPMAKLDKAIVPHYLWGHEKLMDLIWWCESPQLEGKEYKTCGNCPSCLDMKAKKYYVPEREVTARVTEPGELISVTDAI